MGKAEIPMQLYIQDGGKNETIMTRVKNFLSIKALTVAVFLSFFA